MNDLRLILLGIGLLIIAAIYFWGTFIQKTQDRSRARKITRFEHDSYVDANAMPDYDDNDEVNLETLTEMEQFLTNPERSDIDTANFSLRAKTENIDAQEIQLSKSVTGEANDSVNQNIETRSPDQQAPRQQIITLLIKAAANNEFSGLQILEATEAVGLKFGDMKIFHHYGMKGAESSEAIFSLASMYEPGYFDMDKMQVYHTSGLTLFMQLPAPINNMLAFDLMQETAMRLASMLDGEIWTSRHKAVDENALQAMRDLIVEAS